MKLTTDTRAFVAAMKASIKPEACAPPIRKHLLIDATKATRMLGTDLDAWTRIKFIAKVKAPGKALVPYALTLSILNGESGPLEIEYTESAKAGSAILRVGGCEYKFETPTVSMYPVEPPVSKARLTTNAQRLNMMIQRTAFCAQKDPLRRVVNGVQIECAEDGLRMVATDGHRLSVTKDDSWKGSCRDSILIPIDALTWLTKNLDDGDVSIAVDAGLSADSSRYIHFSKGVWVMSHRCLMVGQFPNWLVCMPKPSEATTKLKFDDAETLRRTVERVAKFSPASKAIALRVTKKDVKLTASSVTGDAEATLAVTQLGDEVTVGFDSSYLISFLSRLKAHAPVEVELSGFDRAASFTSPGVDWQYILMPLRL